MSNCVSRRLQGICSTCNTCRRMNICKSVTLFSCLVLPLLTQGTAKLTITPADRKVSVGQSAFFNCSGNNVIWRYCPIDCDPNQAHDKDIYLDNQLTDGLKEKGFRIEVGQTPGQKNLIMVNVTKDMAGTYECIDDDGDDASAKLTVIGSFASDPSKSKQVGGQVTGYSNSTASIVAPTATGLLAVCLVLPKAFVL